MCVCQARLRFHVICRVHGLKLYFKRRLRGCRLDKSNIWRRLVIALKFQYLASWLSLIQSLPLQAGANFILQSWGEEQQLGFVVLPKLKNVGAMLDSTYSTAKTREEQQQVPPKVLFYHSKKNSHKIFFKPISTFANSVHTTTRWRGINMVISP